MKTSGRPRDPESGCTGRTQFQIVCSEHGTVGKPHSLKLFAGPAAAAHRQEHRAALAICCPRTDPPRTAPTA
ncbi:hypothetical protein [Streptomyces sp. NPDC003032]